MLGPCEAGKPVCEAITKAIVIEMARNDDLTRTLVNTCGEATLTLLRVIDKAAASEDGDPIAIAVNLWRNLMWHLNEKLDASLLVLTLENLQQLADVLEKVSAKWTDH